MRLPHALLGVFVALSPPRPLPPLLRTPVLTRSPSGTPSQLWYDLEGNDPSSPTVSQRPTEPSLSSAPSASSTGFPSFYAAPFPSASPAAKEFLAAAAAASPSASSVPSPPGLVLMGTVRMHAFELRTGLNRLRMTIHLDASISEHARAGIGAFIGRWMSGHPQRIHTRGPVGYAATYLNMVSEVQCAVEAIPRPLFTGRPFFSASLLLFPYSLALLMYEFTGEALAMGAS